MFKFFFVIIPLIVLFFIFLFGFSVLRGIFRLMFGGGQVRNSHSAPESKQEQRSSNHPPKKHDKVFSKEDGEYVDYEEIKDQ